MKWLAAIALLLVVVLLPQPSQAQSPQPAPTQAPSNQVTPIPAQSDTLRVGTRIVKPFVFEEGDSLTGFSVDLWQEIALLLGTRTEWDVRPTVADLLEVTQSREDDLAISAISITEERERSWDFSQPMFDAGLQIMTLEQGGSSGPTRILEAIFSPEYLPILGFIVVGAVVAGNIVWFAERRRKDGVFEGSSYFPAIFDAIFWASSTLATQAEMWPKSAIARVVAVVWMFTAVVFIAIFTATITSALTVQQLRTDIQGPDDLPGKRVATVRNSTSAQYLSQRNITTSNFDTPQDALAALEQGDVDAVVYDAPVLQYYASHEGKGKVQVVGSVFRKEAYGILFPDQSPYRKRVNEALLRLRENGTYDRLQTKWFGGEGGKSAG